MGLKEVGKAVPFMTGEGDSKSSDEPSLVAQIFFSERLFKIAFLGTR
jgi:hypothetical protein